MKNKKTVVLTIAGFDPSSGAGVTADLKTIAAQGLYGIACLTSLTVQTSQGVLRTEAVPPKIVRETLQALVEDTPPAATKIGMLGTGEVATVIAEFLRARPLPYVVLDPVFHSSSGAALLDRNGVRVLKRELLTLVEVVTPNLDEASFLTGIRVADAYGMKEAAQRLHEMGARNVIIKGGHLPKPVDLLSRRAPDGSLAFQSYPGRKVETVNTHGTGCAFSTAVACNLALGAKLSEAVRNAKRYVAAALRSSYSIGKGPGPVNHLVPFRNQ